MISDKITEIKRFIGTQSPEKCSNIQTINFSKQRSTADKDGSIMSTRLNLGKKIFIKGKMD